MGKVHGINFLWIVHNHCKGAVFAAPDATETMGRHLPSNNCAVPNGMEQTPSNGTFGRRWGICIFEVSSLPLEQRFLDEDLYSWGFQIYINAYWCIELRIFDLCMRIYESEYFQILLVEVRPKNPHNEDFHRSKSSGVYNWKCGFLFLLDLVFKCDRAVWVNHL